MACSLLALTASEALHISRPHRFRWHRRFLLSEYMEGDVIVIADPDTAKQRLCVVDCDSLAQPVCRKEDDVPEDVYLDLRVKPVDVRNEDVQLLVQDAMYGQRPVPSLGGGPGYGADADEVWSIGQETLSSLEAQGLTIPVLDVGIAHGEKARAGPIS